MPFHITKIAIPKSLWELTEAVLICLHLVTHIMSNKEVVLFPLHVICRQLNCPPCPEKHGQQKKYVTANRGSVKNYGYLVGVITHPGMEFYENVHKIPSLDELSPLPNMPLNIKALCSRSYLPDIVSGMCITRYRHSWLWAQFCIRVLQSSRHRSHHTISNCTSINFKDLIRLKQCIKGVSG